MDAELTWAQAMVGAHQVPGGFSFTDRAEDHFTTSIRIGNHIAQVVKARCRSAAQRHGIARPWIVDVGAGDGLLLRQLVALGFPADRLLGIDVRPRPDGLDVEWIQAVAPDCVPRIEGLLFAHEFLDDIPADVVENAQVLSVAGTPVAPATPQDLGWLDEWAGGDSGVVGWRRDDAWSALVAKVAVGEAVAVDYPGPRIVGHHRGRRLDSARAGDADISAGVELRSCRRATGGRIVPQHRVLADVAADDVQARAELRVLTDRNGLGAFEWLITDVPSIGSRT